MVEAEPKAVGWRDETRTWRAEELGHEVLKLHRHPCWDSGEAVGLHLGPDRQVVGLRKSSCPSQWVH